MSQKSHVELRRLRRQTGVDQRDLAKALGCDAAGLSRFERHGTPLPYYLTPADYESALMRLIKSGATR